MRRAVIGFVLLASSVLPAAAQTSTPAAQRPTNLVSTLTRAQQLSTFLSLLEQVNYKTLGLTGLDGQGRPLAGPGGGPRYHTLFIPNDLAMAGMGTQALTALRNDPARLRAFVLSHMVEGRVTIEALPMLISDGTPQVAKPVTKLKTRAGTTLNFTRDPRAKGQSPGVNGRGHINPFQNVAITDFMLIVHEVDQLLLGDGSV